MLTTRNDYKVIATVTIVLTLLAACVGAEPTATLAPPTDTSVSPTVTPVPPTDTLPPPTATPEPSVTATPMPPLSGSGGGVIAFVSERDGNPGIYLMNADGTDQRRLTDKSTANWSPAWSPAPPEGGTGGAQIAFTSERDGIYGVYVMNADGSNQRRLTSHKDYDWGPAWSPAPPEGGTGGAQIAFNSNRDGKDEVYVMNTDGSNQQRLTDNAGLFNIDPAWSPDGSLIAFASDRDGNYEIYVMDVHRGEGGHFVSESSLGQRRLTTNDADDWWPTWSPDGAQIAFASKRDGNWEIYAMNADGSDQRRLTNNEADDWWPDWSPDRSQIAFASKRDGNWEIYVMDASGGNLQRLTTNEADDTEPAWQPSLAHQDGSLSVIFPMESAELPGGRSPRPLHDPGCTLAACRLPRRRGGCHCLRAGPGRSPLQYGGLPHREAGGETDHVPGPTGLAREWAVGRRRPRPTPSIPSSG